jgi:hypothetical protein
MSTQTGHNWASYAFFPELAKLPEVIPTQFEQLVKELRLTNQPEKWPNSIRLRAFAENRYKIRYVPEWLLVTFGLIDGDEEPPPKPVKPEKAHPFRHTTPKSQAYRDHIGTASRAYWERKKAAA